MRPFRLAAALLLGVTAAAIPSPARADSAAAYCVLSKPDNKTVPRQGPCRWSQRQGNATVLFQSKEYDFPAAEEGRTYTRMNREGKEAGPVFTRKGQYTLSVYWRKPAAEPGGF